MRYRFIILCTKNRKQVVIGWDLTIRNRILIFLRKDQRPDTLLLTGPKVQNVADFEIHLPDKPVFLFCLCLHLSTDHKIHERLIHGLLCFGSGGEIIIRKQSCLFCSLHPLLLSDRLDLLLQIISQHQRHVLSEKIRQHLVCRVGPSKVRFILSRALRNRHRSNTSLSIVF